MWIILLLKSSLCGIGQTWFSFCTPAKQMFFWGTVESACLSVYKMLIIVLLLCIEPFPKQALVFTCLQNMSFENNVGKGEIARYEQFLLFPQSFLPIWKTFCHIRQTQSCRLQTLFFRLKESKICCLGKG